MPGHRTRTGTVARGVLALLGILAVLVVIPTALWTLGGNPLPTSIPPVDQLWQMATTDTDGTLFLGTLKLLGWAGWLSLAVPLLIDVVASLLRLPKPHLPGLTWQQGRAAALTGAVAAMVTVGAAGAATAAPATPTSTPATPVAAAATHTLAPTPTSGPHAPRQVIVERGDTLYGIAQDELGDGDRYPELFEATKSTTQPDGRHLHSPSRIYPGDRIVIPTITHAPAAPPPPPPPPPRGGGPPPPHPPRLPLECGGRPHPHPDPRRTPPGPHHRRADHHGPHPHNVPPTHRRLRPTHPPPHPPTAAHPTRHRRRHPPHRLHHHRPQRTRRRRPHRSPTTTPRRLWPPPTPRQAHPHPHRTLSARRGAAARGCRPAVGGPPRPCPADPGDARP